MSGMEQFLSLGQMLQLSPSLLQSMKVLQMNTLELGEYLNSMAEENPILERDESFDVNAEWKKLQDRMPWLSSHRTDSGDTNEFEPGAEDAWLDSLPALLQDQLERRHLPPPLLALSKYLSELLDDRGYLEQDDLDHLLGQGVPESLLEQAVQILQSLEPPGVGARSLEECFQLQLNRLEGEHTVAKRLAAEHLSQLAQKRYAQLAALLGVSEGEIKRAEREIQALTPHPGGAFVPETPTVYVRPDALIGEEAGTLQVLVNGYDLPQLHLSQEYLKMAGETGETEVKTYLQEKLRQARWLMTCVQRRNTTLEACLRAVVQWQSAYFTGKRDTFLPMTRVDIAQQLGMHPSTIGRALRGKYVECKQGLFPVSTCFSRSVGREGAAHSRQEIQRQIALLIRQESPASPLSDQALAEALKHQGITVARRTVAQYRELLGLPTSYERKRAGETP